jgi:signal peptidase
VRALAELKKTWDKYTNGPLGSIIYLVLGFIIAFAVNAFLGLALDTHTPVVAVFSDSMDPTFYKGDMIIVTGENNIQIGDIIVFNVPDRQYPIIHRITSITGDVITTKGDNNLYQDPWQTPKENVSGKAVLKIPLLGWVKILFTQATGIR